MEEVLSPCKCSVKSFQGRNAFQKLLHLQVLQMLLLSFGNAGEMSSKVCVYETECLQIFSLDSHSKFLLLAIIYLYAYSSVLKAQNMFIFLNVHLCGFFCLFVCLILIVRYTWEQKGIIKFQNGQEGKESLQNPSKIHQNRA